jgi:hypothetical protein
VKVFLATLYRNAAVMFSATLVTTLLLAVLAPVLHATANPVPIVMSISPVSVAPGSADLTLTVNGANFISSSTVNWGTTALTTTFVSSSQLTATVTASLIANGGTGWITVVNAGSPQSNVVYLPVVNSISTIRVATLSASVGSTPYRAGQGDFNGDGILDLAVSNYGGDTVSVLIGKGDGTYQPQVTYAVSSSPYNVAVGDVNGDGKLDLVIGHDSGGTLEVLLGNGDGTFQNASTVSTAPTCALDPQLADIDGDGKLDIVVSSWCGSNVYLLKGNGDGTFQTATSIGTFSGSTWMITLADFNGDGKIDVAAATETISNSLHIYLGNGDGTFQAGLSSTPMSRPFAVLAGDFNHDGKPDLVLSSRNNSGISLLLGKGDGTFQAPSSISTGSYYGIDIGDLSGDGFLDIVGVGGGQVKTWFGKGDGTFQAAQTVGSVASATFGVMLGDYATGGGLAVASPDGSSSLDVFLQTVTISPATKSFGTINLGSSSSAQAFTVTNSTASALHVSGISFTGANPGDFSETDTCSSPIGSAGTCTVNVTFTPTATGSRSATLSIADDAPASPHTAAVSGTGAAAPNVQLSTATLSFGNQNDGSASSAQSVTVTNNGNADLTSILISITGANNSEFGQTNTCGSTLTQGSNCSINVTFSPTTGGAKTAAVQIADNAGNSPQTISLSGTGIVLAPVVSLSNGASIAFGNQSLGTSSTQQSITVTNTGNASLTGINVGLTGANAGDFSTTTTCGSTLAASANCSVGVTFTPTATGARTASVSISDNALNSPQSISLSGNGTQTSTALSYIQAAPSPLVAGSAIGTIKVGVYDAFSALVTGSTASIQVTISGPNSFTASQTQPAVSGQATFSFSGTSLDAAGLYTITATSSGLTNAVSTTTVTALLSSVGLVVTGFPSPTYANVVHTFTVAAEDSYGNVITSYTGTVTITSSDPSAVLPQPYTFTGTDQGMHTFGANLVTPGTQSLTASDGTLTGSETNIAVNARPQFAVTTLADDAGSAACDGMEPCSLRSAVTRVNTLTAGDITIDTTQLGGSAPWTATLTNGVLELSGVMSITGPGASQFSISGNNASNVFQVDANAVATINNLTVTDGNSNANGGGILNSGALTIFRIVVSHSTAAQNGGGIFSSGGAAISGSTVSGNTAGGNGGGIANSSGEFVLENSTVSGNTATGNGGGIDNGGSLYLTQDTLATNTSADGSSVENESSGTLTMAQSTASANTATNVSGSTVTNLNSNSGAVTITNSIVAGNTAPGGDCATCGAQNAANLFDTTAATLKLNPLSNNGGETQTMIPTPDSPTIGAGSVPLALDARFATALTSDQRGPNFPRVINGNVDLGAVQSNSGAALTLGFSLPSSVVAGSPQTLTMTALAAGGNPAGGYTGTVHFTSSDPNAQLPADYTYLAGDAGTHTFTVTLGTAGPQTVSVADTVTSGLNASQSVIVGFGANFNIAAVAGSGQTAVAGTAFSAPFSARVTDAYGNTVSGATVAFTAPVSGASGTFATGGSSASVQTNSSGVATAPAFTANSSTGQYTVSASVQGVQNSASFSLTNRAAPDYSVTLTPNVLTIQQGTSGTAAFTVTPTGGYTGTVQFTCSGLPTGATCDFEPAQAVLNGSNTPATVQLTIHTTGANGTMSFVPNAPPSLKPAIAVIAFGLLALAWMAAARKRNPISQRGFAALLLVIGAATAIALSGCGSAAPKVSPSETPAGNYTVDVTANVAGGSGAQHMAALTVTITQ